MEIEIYSKKNDQDKCIELSNGMCGEALHDYLRALAVRARRISILGNSKKQEAISAWHQFLDAIRFNAKMFDDITIHTKWLYSALNNLSNDYIAISEVDKTLEVIEELTNALIHDYKVCKANGDNAVAEEIKNNFRFYLKSCYNLHYQTDDNVISNDQRFKKCEKMLDSID